MRNCDDLWLDVAIGMSRKASQWLNHRMSWGQLTHRLAQVMRTPETVAQFHAMSRDRQGEIKDVGGFVGGYLEGGVRKKGHATWRQIATLDVDHGTGDTWQSFTAHFKCAAVMHSTHKHTPESPRFRLVMPLSRKVNAVEYEAVLRAVAEAMGVAQMDETTYQAERLMYWPSCPRDGEWVWREQKGEPLEVEALLAPSGAIGLMGQIGQMGDQPVAPLAPPDHAVHALLPPMPTMPGKAEDPTLKPGAIGAFCRAHSIEEAIEQYLGHVYKRASIKGRYTYRGATTSGGLVCYEHRFAYSFHESDPTSGKLCNAFDLCRIHLFGNLDSGGGDDVTKLPSYAKMLELAAEDLRREGVTDFDGMEPPEPSSETLKAIKAEDWREKLDIDKNGKPRPTAANVMLILENDPKIKGRLWHDDFSEFDMVEGVLPWDAALMHNAQCTMQNETRVRTWSNRDEANLRVWIEGKYGIKGKDTIRDAREAVLTRHRRHPIREYLSGLQWDGVPRLDTLLVDHLGAADTPLTRAVTRKHFTAAVARVFEPGCKYDYCLILTGPEGIGKSTLFKVMGEPWFSDSMITMEGKQGMEQARGGWLIELSELGGMKRSEVEQVKAYLSRQVDTYRPAYGTVVEHHPRQCVFCGTTNEDAFLRGDTGNRRFWVVAVAGIDGDMRERLEANRDQLWAEAVTRYRAGETLWLPRELEAEARDMQKTYNDATDDPMQVMLAEWLEKPIPYDWNNWEMWRRRRYYTAPEGDEPYLSTYKRQYVCAAQFVCERLQVDMADKGFRFTCRRVNGWLKEMAGWESVPTIPDNAPYGRQRGFRRNEINDDDTEL